MAGSNVMPHAVDDCEATHTPNVGPHRRPGREGAGLLVVARKVNQSIMIGDDIEVSVVRIRGETVRIGIDAPRSVPVVRKELYVETQQDRDG